MEWRYRFELSDKFSIDVEGIRRAVEEIEEGLKPETIKKWCRRVGELARKRCDGDISFTSREATPGRHEIVARRGDTVELDCLIGVIEESLHRMPVTTRALFEELLRDLYRKQSSSSAYG